MVGGILASNRRSHPKSRLGCKTCKLRKVKCDEQKPQCGNCIRHHVPCDFLSHPSTPQPPLSNHQDSQSSGSYPLDPTLSSASASASAVLNLADLELLHNFTTTTFATLTADPTLRLFYRDTVPRLGLECPYIMRTVLALSALHLAHHRTQTRDHYRALAASHHGLASRAAMRHLAELSPPPFSGSDGTDSPAAVNMAQNLYLFGTLTVFFALAAPRKASSFLLVGESGFPDWFFLLSGSKAVMMGYFPSEQRFAGPLAPWFRWGKDAWAERTGQWQSPHEQRLSWEGGEGLMEEIPEEIMMLEELRGSILGRKEKLVGGGGGGGGGSDNRGSRRPDRRGANTRVRTRTGARTSRNMALAYRNDMGAQSSHSSGSSSSSSSSSSMAVDDDQDPIFDDLDDELDDDDDDDTRLRAAYSHAIDELRLSFADLHRAQRRGHPRDIAPVFTWLYMVADDFVPQLRAPPSQEAAAVLAFFAVLLKKLDGHWWMAGWAEHLISRIYDMLDEEHRLWVRWPACEVGWVPPI